MTLWRVSDGSALHTFESPAYDVAFSPNGEILASGEGRIHLWRVSDGELLHVLPSSFVGYGLAFSPDGRLIANGLGDGTVQLWGVP